MINRSIFKYFLEISYKGTNYHGWQIQKNAHSVQQEFNNALFKLFQTKISSIGSGRTDTGVHAEQQFVQVEMEKEINDDHIFKLNHILPPDISINNFFRVKERSSVRYDAVSRTYEYRICRVKNPFLQDMVCFFWKDLDIDKMNMAAKVLLKFNDFESFSKVNTSTPHFLCDMFKAEWFQKGDLLIFRIEANRFLRGMVRAIVGTLLEVGLGRLSVAEFEKIIEKKDRKAAGRAAPASGLFLIKIKYPAKLFYK
jgi:tRNA pseudouridine38-40 synthase